MNRILYISLSVILFISCGNKDREILVKLMQEWKGREILYPNDMHFFMQGLFVRFISDNTIPKV